MANYDEIGEYGLNQVLTKRLTTPGGSVAPTVAPELFPNLVLENDRPEWGWLKGERTAACFLTRAAVAGQFGAAQLYLPSTAQTIAVVTSIKSANSNEINLARLVGIGGGLAGWSALTPGTTDFRWPATQTQVLVETTANAVQPSQHATLGRLNATNTGHYGNIVIAPGTALGFVTNAVNLALWVIVTWYERPVQPGELP